MAFPTRGERQGCLLSPYLFILGAEILSNKLRQTAEIKGIKLFGNEVKISQFADDTNLFCADVTSVDHALNVVNRFGAISGLKLNVKKTKAIWLGTWLKNKTKPLPRLEEPIDAIGNAKWLNSTMDLASGFNQVAMDIEDRHKTAFTTPFGIFQYNRMPMGMTNSPATFQRLMQTCLNDYIFQILLVYLVDIIVYSD